eukprot:190131_1
MSSDHKIARKANFCVWRVEKIIVVRPRVITPTIMIKEVTMMVQVMSMVQVVAMTDVNDGPSDPSGGYDDVNDDPSDVNDPSGGYDDDNDGPIGDNSGGNNDDDDFDGGESPCKEDEFQCLYEGNPVCTPNSWRCDQYQDCDDKEVEDQGCGGRFEHEEDVSTGAGSTSTMSVVTIVVLSVLAIAIVAFAVYCVCTRRTKTVYKKGLSNEDQMKDTNPMNMGEEFDEIEIETETMN